MYARSRCNMGSNPASGADSGRSAYWDMIKGIGITAIVVGHTAYFGGKFLYLFHVALFFFITGFFYNEKKYADDPWGYFAQRVRGVWPRYVIYTSVLALLHNFFVKIGIYGDTPLYSGTTMLTSVMSSVVLQSPEQLQGALWFVPVWVVSAGLFGGCVWLGNRIETHILSSGPADSERHNLRSALITGAVTLIPGAAGLIFGLHKTGAILNLHAAPLAVPVYWCAWMVRRYLPNYRSFTGLIGWILSTAFLQGMVLWGYRVNIADVRIPGLMFYVFTLIGAYHVLSFGSILEKYPPLSPLAALFAVLGRHSFDIMALHFTVFKGIDFLYCHFINPTGYKALSVSPVSFRFLGPVYILAGILLPVIPGMLLDKLKNRLLTK